jgi:hypothetical protein
VWGVPDDRHRIDTVYVPASVPSGNVIVPVDDVLLGASATVGPGSAASGRPRYMDADLSASSSHPEMV